MTYRAKRFDSLIIESKALDFKGGFYSLATKPLIAYYARWYLFRPDHASANPSTIFHVPGKAPAVSPNFPSAKSQSSRVGSSMIECAIVAALNYPPEVCSLRKCHLREVS